MVRFPGLAYRVSVVARPTQAGHRTGAVRRRARPEVEALGAMGGMTDAAGACGCRYAQCLPLRGCEPGGIVGAVPGFGELPVTKDAKLGTGLPQELEVGSGGWEGTASHAGRRFRGQESGVRFQAADP